MERVRQPPCNQSVLRLPVEKVWLVSFTSSSDWNYPGPSYEEGTSTTLTVALQTTVNRLPDLQPFERHLPVHHLSRRKLPYTRERGWAPTFVDICYVFTYSHSHKVILFLYRQTKPGSQHRMVRTLSSVKRENQCLWTWGGIKSRKLWHYKFRVNIL